MKTLISQSLTLWLSVFATVISLCSFLLAYKNSKHSLHLGALEKRTHLLTKLTDAMSKIATAKNDLTRYKLNLSLSESYLALKAQHTNEPAIESAIRHAASVIEDLTGSQSSVERIVAGTEEEVNRLWAAFENVTEKADAKELETYLPEVERMLVNLGIISNDIASTKNRSEEVLTALHNSLKLAT